MAREYFGGTEVETIKSVYTKVKYERHCLCKNLLCDRTQE